MAFGDDIDTLSLTFDKLRYIFNGYDVIRDSFLKVNTLHKQGNITDHKFFDKIQESIMQFSALAFLSIKSIFEIKKALNRSIGSAENTAMTANPSVSNIQVPSHSISVFIVAGTLPRLSSQMTHFKIENINCLQCKSLIRKSSNFCVNCSNKI
jgi:hypothetical protein